MNEKEKDIKTPNEGTEQTNAKPKSAYSSLKGFKRAIPILLVGCALFFALCFVTQNTGVFGAAVSKIFLGLFSVGGYFIPLFFLLHAVFYPADTLRKRTFSRVIFSAVTLLTISTVTHCITYINTEFVFSVSDFYNLGMEGTGGGFFGGIIAFGLMKAFGKVGLFVIAGVVIALYIAYFFAGGRSSMSKALLGILNFVSDIFTGMKRRSKMRKTEKRKKTEAKRCERLAAAQEGLTSDEFFAVDNGMSEIHISKLGISEVRDEAELERNPDLKTKVFHKSAISENEYQRSREGDDEYTFFAGDKSEKRTAFSDKNLYDSVDESKFAYRDDDIIYDGVPSKSERAMYGLDENADDVFNDKFEAFDFKVNQEIASRPSSKAQTVAREPDEVYEYTDPIEYEKREEKRLAEEKLARERAEFERKKAIAVEARRKIEEKQNNVAEILGEDAPQYTPSYSTEPVNMSFESNGEVYKEEFTENAKQDYIEEVSFEFGPKREEPVYTPPVYEEPVYTPPSYEEPVYTPPSYEEPVFSAVHEESEYKAEYSEPEIDSDIYEKNGDGITISRSTLETEDEPDYTEEENVSGAALEFEFDTESVDFGEDTDSDNLFTFDGEEDEEEEFADGEIADAAAEEYSENAEEDNFDEDEIPPAEQNPDVIKMREMFPFLSETEPAKKENDKNLYEYEDEEERRREENAKAKAAEPPFEVSSPLPADIQQSAKAPEIKKEEKEQPVRNTPDYSDYKHPPIELLKEGSNDDDESFAEERQQNADKLIDALEQFNIKASIKGIDHGPRITRYEIVPARGVRVNQITNLFDDIALAMAAEGIRMEAPIPGKSAIGVEIPNKHPSLVLLRDLVESDEFITAKNKTTACVGKDVTGNPVFCDISKMPHLLIAGATGMGKSVCINSILVSILYKARPDEVKFIMIDPKKVEFNGYNGIPHLLVPVVTDVKQAAGALMWACEQMEKRYDLMEKFEVRNLDGYNDKVKADPSLGEPLPKIIIVIDELNDIMLQVRKPAEDLIMSIAQKARAAGIHLIIGTQRPSVDVITGVIKANIPSRISCKVTSGTDSKTILDTVGAEKLLKNGDMLFNPAGAPKPLRVQGAFVSDSEVSNIMKFLKSQVTGNVYDEQALEEINNAAKKCSKGKGDDDFDDDDGQEENVGILNDQQFLDAVDLAIRQKKISTSLIQRKISIGYGKAAKFIDYMEDLGIVSEPNGQKPRDVLITADDWHEMLARRSLD